MEPVSTHSAVHVARPFPGSAFMAMSPFLPTTECDWNDWRVMQRDRLSRLNACRSYPMGASCIVSNEGGATELLKLFSKERTSSPNSQL